MPDDSATQPVEANETMQLSDTSMALYRAAARIATLERELEKLQHERDDLMRMLKQVLEKL